MLTRPTLNIVVLLALMVSPFFLDLGPFVGYVLVVIFIVWAGLLFLGRDFFVGRSLGSKRRWEEAIVRYEAFEARAKRLRYGSVSLPFFMSIYTYNGVALAKNNMAFCCMNNGELERARRLCVEALELDPKYAVPHINLAIIAALGNDAEAAGASLQRGFDLGYRNRGVQRQVRQIVARANLAVGDVLPEHGGRDDG